MLAPIRRYLGNFCHLKLNPRLLYQSEGSAVVEYAIIMGLLVASLLISIQSVGSRTSTLFRMVSGELLSTGSQGGGAWSSVGKESLQAPTSIASVGKGT